MSACPTTAHIATNEDLKPRQQKAIAALLAQPTLQEAAALAGVSDTTLDRWLKEPAFREAYRQARQETVGHVIVQVQKAATTAVDTLVDVMTDGDATAGARVSAAKAVLDVTIRASEMESVIARIEALEAAQEGRTR